MALPSMNNVKKLIQSIQGTKDEELACGECFAVLDQFMELVMQGNEAADLMPLVQGHLDQCGDCHEEFEALLKILDNLHSFRGESRFT
ncbi:MAG: hypothetical protein R3335_11985, partial [Anaerolineales bacterium]|nr:hypothetical protein [Anaerolineales bacterium]